MHTFDIKTVTDQFPNEVSGTIVADDGQDNCFYETVRPFEDRDITLIPLFINEFANQNAVKQIAELHVAKRIGAVVTFGIFSDLSHHEVGTSHFDIIAREICLPVIQLVKPEGYPYFFHDWVDNNPLRPLYGQTATLTLDAPGKAILQVTS